MSFDPKRPYCTVYGHSIIRYEQDGKKYTKDGHPVVEAIPVDATPQNVTPADVKHMSKKDRKEYFRKLVG